MDIRMNRDRDVTIAEIIGNLDTLTAIEAEASLNRAIDEGAGKLLIDFSHLDFITSAGLRTLLGLAKRQRSEGGTLHLANMNETVREIFSISGFDTIIESSPTVEDALGRILA